MKNCLRITESLLLLLILLVVGPVGADDWPGPRTIVAFSDSGVFFVRIVPGKSYGDVIGFAGEPKGSYAKAEFYSRHRDRSFKLLWEKVTESGIPVPSPDQ